MEWNEKRSNNDENEIVCCGTLYQFNLTSGQNQTQQLVVTPCDQPTAVFDIATISTRNNNCTGLTFYQAAINTDPVEIIQDCNLRCLICRSIEIYMNNNSCGCGCNGDSCGCRENSCGCRENTCRCQRNNFSNRERLFDFF